MASDVEISNRALAALGHTAFISSFDDTSTAGRLANLDFASRRDELLRAHRWKFASKRASLAADATDPIWGKSFYYTLPTDYLAIIEVNGEAIRPDMEWSKEGRKVITDLTAPLEILYTRRVTDPNEFDASFQATLVAYLAKHWALAITGDDKMKKDKNDEYIVQVSEARSLSSIEATPNTMVVDTWDNARQ